MKSKTIIEDVTKELSEPIKTKRGKKPKYTDKLEKCACENCELCDNIIEELKEELDSSTRIIIKDTHSGEEIHYQIDDLKWFGDTLLWFGSRFNNLSIWFVKHALKFEKKKK